MSTIATGNMTLTWDHQITEKMIPGLEKGLTAGAVRVVETARGLLGRNHGGIRSLPGAPPNSQTGDLSRRLVALSPKQNGTPLKAVAGTNVLYAPVLEKGKVIRAKGKLLVIPLNYAAQRLMAHSGHSGRTAIQTLKNQNAGRVSMVKTMEGGLLIGVIPKGKAASRLGHGYRFMENKPIFLLSRKADIKPRPFLRPALLKNAESLPLLIGTVASQEWRAKGLVQ